MLVHTVCQSCVLAVDVKAIAAGVGHSMVLKRDGKVWATGSNNYGQLGDGSTTDKNTFSLVIGTWDIAWITHLKQVHPHVLLLQQTLALDR